MTITNYTPYLYEHVWSRSKTNNSNNNENNNNIFYNNKI